MSRIADILFEHATMQPHATAISDGIKIWTYKDLCEKSNVVAHFLHNNTHGDKKRCLILAGKNNSSVAALFGCCRAGWSFACVNEDFPSAVVMSVMHRLQPDIILVANESGEFGDDIIQTIESSVIPSISVSEIFTGKRETKVQKKESECNSDVSKNEITFYAFTSGSTGSPKIVAMSDTAFLRAIDLYTTNIPFTSADVVGVQSRFAFDGFWDVLSAIYRKGSAVLIPTEQYWDGNAWNDFLDTHGVTSLMCVPAALHIGLDSMRGNQFGGKALRQIIFTGDVIRAGLLERMGKYISDNIAFYNLYSLSEAFYILSTRIDVKKSGEQNCFPIPAANNPTCAVIPGGDKNALHLYVKDYILFDGYFENETLSLPRDAKTGLFETGDIFLRKGENTMCYARRVGKRINWCGFRIEPDEIENALMQSEHIDAARVRVVGESETEDGELMCKIVTGLPIIDARRIASSIIREYVSTEYAEYMVVEKVDAHALYKFR